MEVSDQCYLYIIAHEGDQAPVKIGIAADPKARLRQLQTGNPRVLTLVAQFWALTREQAAYWEMLAHKLFQQSRMSGEWFDCPPSEIVRMVGAWHRDQEPKISAARRSFRQFDGVSGADGEPFHPTIPPHLRNRSTLQMSADERQEYWGCFGLPTPPAGFDDWYIVGSPSSGVLAAFPTVDLDGDAKE